MYPAVTAGITYMATDYMLYTYLLQTQRMDFDYLRLLRIYVHLDSRYDRQVDSISVKDSSGRSIVLTDVHIGRDYPYGMYIEDGYWDALIRVMLNDIHKHIPTDTIRANVGSLFGKTHISAFDILVNISPALIVQLRNLARNFPYLRAWRSQVESGTDRGKLVAKHITAYTSTDDTLRVYLAATRLNRGPDVIRLVLSVGGRSIDNYILDYDQDRVTFTLNGKQWYIPARNLLEAIPFAGGTLAQAVREGTLLDIYGSGGPGIPPQRKRGHKGGIVGTKGYTMGPRDGSLVCLVGSSLSPCP